MAEGSIDRGFAFDGAISPQKHRTKEVLSGIRTRYQRFLPTPHAHTRGHIPRRCTVLTGYLHPRLPDTGPRSNTTSRARSHRIIPRLKIEDERRTPFGTSPGPADDVIHATGSFTQSRKRQQQEAMTYPVGNHPVETGPDCT